MAFVLNAETRQKLNAVPMNDRRSNLTLGVPANTAAPKPVAPAPERKPA